MLNAARAAGFSKYRLMCSPICWKELLNLKLMQIESMCITLMELSKHLRKNGSSDKEKLNVADMFNFKCEERNRYKINCLLSKLLAAVHLLSKYRAARTRADLQLGAMTGLFLLPNQRVVL